MKKVLFYLSGLGFLLLGACNDNSPPVVEPEEPKNQLVMEAFSFLETNNEGAVMRNLVADIKDNQITISSPFISQGKLVANFSTNGESVLVNGIPQESGVTVNDFSLPVTYEIVSSEGDRAIYTVNVSYSGLPVVIIDTPNRATIPSKHEDWLEETTLTILNPDGTKSYSGVTSIRGRGNSTWNFPKKPYALKLDNKAEILGMPKHKRWVLLANWLDRTLLRNRVAFQVAMSTDLAWTPRGEFVDVVLNGEHIGNYYLCEHIKIDENRVDIHEMSDEEENGGFLLELDINYDEVNKFLSDIKKFPYMFKDPDEVNAFQFAYMQSYINKLEGVLHAEDPEVFETYRDMVDIDSYIDWWFVHELVRNTEPLHPKSVYMYKDKGGKLHAGPCWDFDWLTFTDGTGFKLKDALYYPQFMKDPVYVARLKERWTLLKPKFVQVLDFIDAEAKRIRNSEKMNYAMWPISDDRNVNFDIHLTFDEAVARLRSIYEQKLNWMDEAIADL